MGAFGDYTPERIAKERAAPEFKSSTGSGVAANVARFVPYSADDGHVHTVRDCMRPLYRAPGVVLRLAEFFFFGRMPANCCRVKQNMCTLQRGKARSLRIPLIPTHQRSYTSGNGIECAKT